MLKISKMNWRNNYFLQIHNMKQKSKNLKTYKLKLEIKSKARQNC